MGNSNSVYEDVILVFQENVIERIVYTNHSDNSDASLLFIVSTTDGTKKVEFKSKSDSVIVNNQKCDTDKSYMMNMLANVVPSEVLKVNCKQTNKCIPEIELTISLDIGLTYEIRGLSNVYISDCNWESMMDANDIPKLIEKETLTIMRILDLEDQLVVLQRKREALTAQISHLIKKKEYNHTF